MGKREYLVRVNSSPQILDELKEALPAIEAGLPPALKVTELFDQSIFVRASIKGVLREALIAAGLTGLMILVFLGSWRSTLIVCLSIPLSILTSLIVLSGLHETIKHHDAWGPLALAVGILVDDATVEIENTHRNMGMKKPLVKAVLDGAQQVAVPALVATLSISIVVIPRCFADRRRTLFIHAFGIGCGVCGHGLLSSVAHNHSELSALFAEAGSGALSKRRRRRPGGSGWLELETAPRLQSLLSAFSRSL